MTTVTPLGDAETRRGFLITAGLALGIAVSNGFGRFAYALILPAMRADLNWTYTQAGALSTANAVGYFIGSFIVMTSVRRLGAANMYVAGIWITCVAIFLVGLLSDFTTMIVVRTIAGISGACVLISGSVLAASVFPRHPKLAATAISLYFAGGGIGLLLPGLALPWLFALGGDSIWPWAWIGMGGFGALVGVYNVMAARSVVAPPAQRAPYPWPKRPLLPIFASYGFYAVGYFVYMTFIIAWMRENGSSASEIAGMWIILGVATVAGSVVWSRPISSWSGGRAVAGTILATGIGAVLPLFGTSFWLMAISAALFGSFFMVPAAITAYVKKALPPVVWGEAVAAITLLFAALQLTGPVVTGVIADRTGSLAWGLGFAATFLLIGSLIALLQREPQYRQPADAGSQ